MKRRNLMFDAVRIQADPTTWELKAPHADLPTPPVPVKLQVVHPLFGTLVLSPRSAGSAVFLSRYRILGTRPNGIAIGGGPVVYLPSPHGPDLHSNPENFYRLADTEKLHAEDELEELAGEITAAMTAGTPFTVHLEQGEVIISGASVPFVVLCPPTLV